MMRRPSIGASALLPLGLLVLASCGSPAPAPEGEAFPYPLIEVPEQVVAGTEGVEARVVKPEEGIDYAWEIEGGELTSAAGGESVIFTVGEGPSLALTIVATDAAGRSKSATHYLDVLPQPAIFIGAPDIVTAKREGLTASAPQLEGASYAWSIEGGEILEGQATHAIVFAAGEPGRLGLEVEIVDAQGAPARGEKAIEVVAAPDARLEAPAIVTRGKEGLQASVPAQEASVFEWTIEGGTITEGADTDTVTFTAGEGTSLSLGVAVTNAAGDRAAFGREIAILGAPVANMEAPTRTTKGRAGLVASVPAQEGMSYAWTLRGGAITSAADGPSITFDAGFDDALRLEVVVTNAVGDAARGEAEVRLVWGYSTAVGEMTTPRKEAAAVTLLDGRVLVAGGRSGDTLRSAELFSAETETFSATAPMAVERSDHSMTRLPDGRVLVVGGRRREAGATEVHDSAEIFNPSTETWAPAPSLAEARYAHTATVLEDGRVLVAGGAGADLEGIASAEIFDPVAEAWSPAGALQEARSGHAAHLLADGRVLVVGNALGASAAAELYDPATDAWSPAGGDATLPWQGSLVGLPGGGLLLAGGAVLGADAFESTREALIYNPGADAFLPAAPMNEPRGRQASLLLPNGKVLLAGGVVLVPTETDPLEAGTRTVELYDPLADTFQRAEDLLEPRGRSVAALLPDGRVLIAGGFGDDETEARSTAEIVSY